MKPTAKIDCRVNGNFYSIGDEIKPKNIEQLIELNERGFIEPLTMKQIQEYFNKPEPRKIFKKEEE